MLGPARIEATWPGFGLDARIRHTLVPTAGARLVGQIVRAPTGRMARRGEL